MAPSPYKRCLIFLIDGARPDVMTEEAKQGHLPNLSRLCYDSGTWETMTSVFPSTTGPAYLPLLTGCFPGICNVPGIRWFDKDVYADRGWSLQSFRSYVGLETFLMNSDINPKIQTAFDVFENSHSYFNMVYRGCKPKNNKTRYSRIWYAYYAHLTDHWSFIDQAATRKLIKSFDEGFDFSFVVYPAVDEYSHRSHPHHARVIQAYREFDRSLGTIIHELKKRGLFEETLMMFVADHGLSATHTHFDVGPYLETKGRKTFFYTQILKRGFTAASMISGNGMAHLYFKGERGWKGRQTFEVLTSTSLLIDDLRMQEAVDLLAAQGADGSIHVLNDRGQGSFQRGEAGFNYQWQHGDPLGLFADKQGQKHLSHELAYQISFTSQFSDVFEQLSQLFSSKRSGDVILSAKSGYDLRTRYEVPLHKASHGALCPEHMKIPLLSNAKFSSKNCLRSVDVYPTILDYLDKNIPTLINGKSLR